MRTIYEQIKLLEQPTGGIINPKNVPYTVIPCNTNLHENEDLAPYEMLNFLKLIFQYMDTDFSLSVLQGQLKGISLKSILKTGQEVISTLHGIDQNSIQKIYQLTKLKEFENEILDFNSLPKLSPSDLENVEQYIERYRQFLQRENEVALKHKVRYSDTPNIKSDIVEAVGEDCLWDFSISRKMPTKNQFLTLVVQAILFIRTMGFERIHSIGIYNIRLNTIYKVELGAISDDTLVQLEKEVLGYQNSKVEELLKTHVIANNTELKEIYSKPPQVRKNKNQVEGNSYYKAKKEKKWKKRLVHFVQNLLFISLIVLLFVFILRFIMGPEVFKDLYIKGIQPVYESIKNFMMLGY